MCVADTISALPHLTGTQRFPTQLPGSFQLQASETLVPEGFSWLQSLLLHVGHSKSIRVSAQEQPSNSDWCESVDKYPLLLCPSGLTQICVFSTVFPETSSKIDLQLPTGITGLIQFPFLGYLPFPA